MSSDSLTYFLSIIIVFTDYRDPEPQSHTNISTLRTKRMPSSGRNLSITVESSLSFDSWGNPSHLPEPRHPRETAMKSETPPNISPRWSPNPLKKLLGTAKHLPGGANHGPVSLPSSGIDRSWVQTDNAIDPGYNSV